MAPVSQPHNLAVAGARPVKRTIQRELESALAKVQWCHMTLAGVVPVALPAAPLAVLCLSSLAQHAVSRALLFSR